jgi:hypothetical protein
MKTTAILAASALAIPVALLGQDANASNGPEIGNAVSRDIPRAVLTVCYHDGLARAITSASVHQLSSGGQTSGTSNVYRRLRGCHDTRVTERTRLSFSYKVKAPYHVSSIRSQHVLGENSATTVSKNRFVVVMNTDDRVVVDVYLKK